MVVGVDIMVVMVVLEQPVPANLALDGLNGSTFNITSRGGGGSFISSECTNVNTYSGTGGNYGTGHTGEGKIEIFIIRDSYYDVKMAILLQTY